ncbi:nucleotide-binding oligomerization domain-containing protein 2-like [Engraulis encrasicolus]|uniref:nucleotide-binding oligomerization domain-containing protein 2-like n=1 Tax=Engraulis encrasicolus TaxID=184585 RepID=UPI002FD5E6DC
MEEEENTASASNKGYFRDQLSRVRPELIKRITAAVLKGLLDKLQAHSPPVINNEEAKEILQRSSVEQDQVRSLVDVVDKKGDKACEILMSYLKELDNYLYQDLDLVPPTDKGRDVMEMSSLKQTVQSIFIEKFGFIAQDMETGKKQKLQDIFTDICIIEGPRGVNDEHELSAMDARLDETRTTSAIIKTVKLSDIFSDHYVTGKPVRKVLTLGIAGGGKTFAVQKFVLDWAEGTQNQNIHLVFVLPFRELNMHTDKDYSLFGLLQKFYPDCEELTKAFANKKNLVLFVLDGLDESRMELFKMSISDPTKETSIAELITSLITGDLLSSALIWLLERPEIKHPLDGILPHLSEDVKEMSITKTVDYIKRQINKSNSSERIINLFHCLNELGDNSMIEAIDSTDDCGQVRLNPGLRKYACDVTLDPGTASRYLSLSEGNRKVTNEGKDQRYPDHEDRFEIWHQVLCREGLSGRCYWEAEWSGDDGAGIAVAYKSIQRKGDGDNVIMGWNAKSWSLSCSTGSCAVYHNNKRTAIPATSSRSRRVGVYLDWLAGTLSFYSVSSGTLTHLHTFHCTFTEPLYPGFTVWGGSSVSLCQIT